MIVPIKTKNAGNTAAWLVVVVKATALACLKAVIVIEHFTALPVGAGRKHHTLFAMTDNFCQCQVQLLSVVQTGKFLQGVKLKIERTQAAAVFKPHQPAHPALA